MSPDICELISLLYYDRQLHSSHLIDNERELREEEEYHHQYHPLMMYSATSSEVRRSDRGNVSIYNPYQVNYFFLNLFRNICSDSYGSGGSL